MLNFPPERIICLSNETVETIYLLGEEKRIVGVTGFASRPTRVRKEKLRVSAFASANVTEILDLKPDLIFTFSDVQADLSRELVLAGLNVFCFNQRSIAGILSMINMIGAILNRKKRAEAISNEIVKKIQKYKLERQIVRPRIYFEEWDDPLIVGIRWVSEIIEIAGGVDIFSERSKFHQSKSRYVRSREVIEANPDIIMVSWCGKKFDIMKIKSRNGWQHINAVRHENIFGVDSMEILQPGPAALIDGLRSIREIIVGFQPS